MKFVTTTVDEDGIAVVSYSRPPVNAFNNEAYAEMEKAFRDLRFNEDVRVIILYSPDKWFSVGNDVKEAGANPTYEMEQSNLLGIQSVEKRIRESPVPVIAAIRGYAIGAGLGFVMNSDFIVASETAKITMPEMKVGILGGWVGGLHNIVPESMVRYMIYTSKAVPCTELVKYGGIFKVVPDDQLLDAAKDLARELTRNGPVAIKWARRCMNIYRDRGNEEHRAYGDLLKELYFEDHWDERVEAIESFNGHREPNYKRPGSKKDE